MIAGGYFSHLRIANLPAKAKSALPRLQSWPVFGKGKKASEAQEERIKNWDGAISLISSHEFWTNLSKYHRNQPIQNITKSICQTRKNIVAKIIILKDIIRRGIDVHCQPSRAPTSLVFFVTVRLTLLTAIRNRKTGHCGIIWGLTWHYHLWSETETFKFYKSRFSHLLI